MSKSSPTPARVINQRNPQPIGECLHKEMLSPWGLPNRRTQLLDLFILRYGKIVITKGRRLNRLGEEGDGGRVKNIPIGRYLFID